MTLERTTWRLVTTPPASGSWNMAIDEAILQSIGKGLSPATLRFYAWDPPCLSLGYAQPVGDVDLSTILKNGWQIVRRPTGGRAILHTDELTYSVTAPNDEPRIAGAVVESYYRLSQALLHALRMLGIPAEAREKPGSPLPTYPAPIQDHQINQNIERPNSGINSPAPINPVCFEVPSTYEITVRGKKLLGSAQARRKEGVLQHGSFPLQGDLSRILQALVFSSETHREDAAKRLSARATTAKEVLGKIVTWEEAVAIFIRGFEETLNLDLVQADLSPGEQILAEELQREKYATFEWTHRV